MRISLEFAIKDELTKWDHTPGMSTLYSGPTRMFLGAVQVVVGSALALISLLFGAFNEEKNNLKEWKDRVIFHVIEAGHGLGNILRGIVALVPVIGNGLLKIYDGTFLGAQFSLNAKLGLMPGSYAAFNILGSKVAQVILLEENRISYQDGGQGNFTSRSFNLWVGQEPDVSSAK